MTIFAKMAAGYGLVGSFIIVAVTTFLGYKLAELIGQKRMGSAFAILLALVVAYIGGVIAHKQIDAGVLTTASKGITDVVYWIGSGDSLKKYAIFGGVGILGGGMMRDFAIISTAWGVDPKNLVKAGLAGIVALLLGLILSFVIGVVVGRLFGYTDVSELATIGAGVQTFVVGPVTGAAFGVKSEVVALSIAAGAVKSIAAMIIAPLIAKKIKLDNPTGAMIFGGLIGSTSGTAGGLAAVDAKLVPYGAMVATFYTGLGCLLTPTIFTAVLRMIMG
ncbi:MAG: malonate transporter subunit MadM [Erysipelotrichaceae bacterium]|nr:malonate transporter subunit MadM [Erysipelotrichaceae bacterium]